jgi:hypothetical protein
MYLNNVSANYKTIYNRKLERYVSQSKNLDVIKKKRLLVIMNQD